MYTLKEVKDIVLSLIDEYSVDGQLIGEADNMDYLNRIPMLVNMLQMEWCRLVKMPTSYVITHGEVEALYPMPSDFMEIDKIVKENYEGSYALSWNNRKTLKLLASQSGTYTIHYFKYPAKLTSASPNTTELDICDEAANISPFKIAALLFQSEKPEIARNLLDIYNQEKKMVINRQSHEPQYTQRVFSIGG
jgi:hypothetical protein